MNASPTFQQQLSDIVGSERAGEIRRLILHHFAENERPAIDNEIERTTESSVQDSASPADMNPFFATASTYVNNAAVQDPYPPAPQSRQGNYGSHLMPTQLPLVPQLSQQSYRPPQADSGFIDDSVHESPFGASPNPFQQIPFEPFHFGYNVHGAFQGYAASTPGMNMPHTAQGSRQARNNSTPGHFRVAHSAHASGIRYDGTRNHIRTCPEDVAWASDLDPHDVPNISPAHWRTDSVLQDQEGSSHVQWRNSFAPRDHTDPSNDDAVQ
jgi:hypothetical protein